MCDPPRIELRFSVCLARSLMAIPPEVIWAHFLYFIQIQIGAPVPCPGYGPFSCVIIRKILAETMTAVTRASSNCKRQNRPVVREGAPHPQTRNCLTVIKIWSWAPDGCLTARQTGRLTVGRNITLRVDENFNSSANFIRTLQYQISWRFVQRFSSFYTQTHGQTHTPKLMSPFFC
jgi:hypothetical protein